MFVAANVKENDHTDRCVSLLLYNQDLFQYLSNIKLLLAMTLHSMLSTEHPLVTMDKHKTFAYPPWCLNFLFFFDKILYFFISQEFTAPRAV